MGKTNFEQRPENANLFIYLFISDKCQAYAFIP